MTLLRWLSALALVLSLWSLSALAQLTVPNTFTTRQVISSLKFNQNFDEIELKALNRVTPILQGTLTVDTNAAYDIGATALRFRDFWFSRNGAIGGTLAVTGNVTFSGTANTLGTVTSGIWNAGAVTSSGAITDSVGSMATIRAGGLAVASQTAGDVFYATSATQLARLNGTGLLQLNGAGAPTLATAVADMSGGRLTLESGVAVSTTDQSAKTTLYYTPHVHNFLSLYDGSTTWTTVTFSELSITLAGLTASKPYDVFAFNNSGTATLELLVWTNTTTRATALVKQDGRWVKSGATTRRYLGTIYINSTGGQTDDTFAKRYVWNANNRVARPMRVVETTASWAQAAHGWRQANAAATNQLDFIVGLPDVAVSARAELTGSVSGGAAAGEGTSIGLDSTTTPATGCLKGFTLLPNVNLSMFSSLTTYPGIGRHTLVWLETGDGGTFVGTGTDQQSGIDGFIEG